VLYNDDARKDAAVQVAKAMGLPEAVVRKSEGRSLADIVVTLGADYKL
jgi:hypothetical protein